MKRKQILIMDDSALVLEMTRQALVAAGYDVICARDLAELDAHRASATPDLILLDVQMPEAFGDDIGMVLRAGRGVRVPILLFSNLDEHELAERARGAEIDGYVSKHAGLPALIERVRELLP